MLYHERGILVVNKPSGLPSQAARSADPEIGSLYEQLQNKYDYVGLHHRLDQPASGLLLFTTTREHNKAISEAFKAHDISRSYLLVVAGKLESLSGSWNSSIDNKQACTHWKMLGYARRMTLLEASLETGRRHQIRKHAADDGHPLIGDRRYGGIAGQLWPRLALHACRLSFEHPLLKQRISINAPVPLDLHELFTRFPTLPDTPMT